MVIFRQDRYINDKLPVLLCLAVLFPFLYRNLIISKMWAFGDLLAFPTDMNVIRNWTFYVWFPDGLGFLSFKPFSCYLVMLALSSVFGSLLAQKIMFVFLPAVSFVTFYVLLRRFEVSSVASILGSLVYAINPVIISEMLVGSLTLAAYASFPIILLYVIKVIRQQRFNLRDAIILGLLSFFVFNIHAAFWLVIILVPPVFVVLYSQIGMREMSLRRIPRLIIPVIISTLILLPNILGYLGLYGGASSASVTFVPDAAYAYKDSTVYNIVRFAGNRGTAQAAEFLNFDTLNGYTALGYVMPIVAFFFFIRSNRVSKEKRAIAVSSGLAFVISCGLILFIKAVPSVVDLNPIMSSLRNPAKLMYPLSFSLCLLFALGAEQLVDYTRVSRRKLSRKLIVGVLLAALVLLSNYPALDGTLGLALPNVHGNNYYVENKYLDLPSMLKRIDDHYEDYRVLFLPWEVSSLQKVPSYVPNYFGMPIGAAMSSDIEVLRSILETVTTSKSGVKGDLLGLFAVKYVVIDKNFKSGFQGQKFYEGLKNGRSSVVYRLFDSYWATGDPNYYYQLFGSDRDFVLVDENPDFAIFENTRAITKIHTRSNVADLRFSDIPISGNLLINPSFENATEGWQRGPQGLVNVSYYDDGNSAMVLYGHEKWFTTCNQAISVEEDAVYDLRFSVKGYNITDMHAKILWYNITEDFTEDNASSVDYIDLSLMNIKEGEWTTIEKTLSAPKAARTAIVWFGANRLGVFKNTTMYIDDVSFNQVTATVSNTEEVFSSIRNVNYTKINPTKYVAELNTVSSFVLVLSETYSPSWVGYVNNEKLASFPVFGMLTGFWLNKTGQLDVVIEYEPQKWFSISSIISIVTLIPCTTYLIYKNSQVKTMGRKIKHRLVKADEASKKASLLEPDKNS